MPEKNLPPDWLMAVFALLSTAMAGVFGALVRQLANPGKGWMERLSEWIVGGCMAVFASPTVAQIMHHMLLKWDMIARDAGLSPDNILGLAGFLCGAMGVSGTEIFAIWLRKKLGLPPTKQD